LTEKTFHAMGVSDRVCAALRKRDIVFPFRIQTLALEPALAGRDVLAKSPTGSGKTLAFSIPIVERLAPNARTPAALILVPTRELAQQVTDELAPLAQARGLRVAEVYGGVGLDLQARRARGAHVVVATPGRLEDLLGRGLLKLDQVRILVLDEADRMLDLGFAPAVDRILGILPENRQTMFFSATLDGVVEKHAQRSTRDPVRIEAQLPVEQIGEVAHRFMLVEHEHKVDRLVDVLGEERDLALVFVRTKRGAARLARRLEQRGVRAAALHGDMTQPQRARSLDRFERGHADTLVATDVAARGLDVDDITHVINFDLPDDAVAYTHRVGRTGRAGRSGTGITMVLPDQRDAVVTIARTKELHDELAAAGISTAQAGPRRKGGKRGGQPSSRRRFSRPGQRPGGAARSTPQR
jgi:superfamily II DNA/RNA helicase